MKLVDIIKIRNLKDKFNAFKKMIVIQTLITFKKT